VKKEMWGYAVRIPTTCPDGIGGGYPGKLELELYLAGETELTSTPTPFTVPVTVTLLPAS
jgi:hypothetical protein